MNNIVILISGPVGLRLLQNFKKQKLNVIF